MEIKRDRMLLRLEACRRDGKIKVVTGIKGCGKSYLLFHLFYEYLLKQGADADHIIGIHLDTDEGASLRKSVSMVHFVKKRIGCGKRTFYLIIDECQLLHRYEEVLTALSGIKNLDIYITGSSSAFLSEAADPAKFGGMGREIRMYPLSFAEYCEATGKPAARAADDYQKFGGLPALISMETELEKETYLKRLFVWDGIPAFVKEFGIRNQRELLNLAGIFAESEGAVTNAHRLSESCRKRTGITTAPKTVERYLEKLERAYILERACRYDVNARKEIQAYAKYFFTDQGAAGVILGKPAANRQAVREGFLFRELRREGYSVWSGVHDYFVWENQKKVRRRENIGLIAGRSYMKEYIQCTCGDEKMENAERGFWRIDDCFRKTLIVDGDTEPRQDEKGVRIVGVKYFAMNPEKYLGGYS